MAGASFTDTRGYDWFIAQSNGGAGAVATTGITVPATPYGFARTGLQSVWEISATYQSVEPTSGTSTVTFQFQVDGTNLSGCSWVITRTATEITALGLPVLSSALSSDHSFFVRCLNATVVNPGAHTYAITATGTNPVTNARTDIMLKQMDSVTDTSLDALATTAEVRARTAYTNNLVNQTRVAVLATWDRVNTTCQKFTLDGCEGVLGGNVTVNSTQLEEIFLSVILAQMNPIALVLNDFFWLLAIVALAVWAEYGKSWLAYLLVSIGLLLAAINLSTSPWLRLIIVGAALVALVRTLILRDESNMETDEE